MDLLSCRWLIAFSVEFEIAGSTTVSINDALDVELIWYSSSISKLSTGDNLAQQSVVKWRLQIVMEITQT